MDLVALSSYDYPLFSRFRNQGPTITGGKSLNATEIIIPFLTNEQLIPSPKCMDSYAINNL